MQHPAENNLLPTTSLKVDDRKARIAIWIFSVIVFIVIASLSRIKLNVQTSFDPHLFAMINAIINSIVSLLLIMALVAVKRRKYFLHKKIMITAIILSVLFLLSYITHHILTGDTKFGDVDHNGILSDAEKQEAGGIRYLYYVSLLTHIPLAGIILPVILFTAYRALSAHYNAHKKLARITWPVWFYVAVTGVIIFWMIRPYY